MLSLSLMLKEMQNKINNLEIGGSGTLTLDTSKIQLGNVTYHDGNPTITTRYANGNVYFDFVLTNPITDAKQFGAVVVNSTIHHVVDRITLTVSPKTSFTLTEKPNSCPVVITINGFSYLESGSGDDVFTVNRDTKTVTWHSSKAGFDLTTETATTVYVSYEVSEAVVKKRENINVSSIVNNSFKLTDTPNATPVGIIINGVSYFEEGNEFTVNRAVSPVSIVWNQNTTGFALDSSLTGYITVLYEIDLS